MTGCTPGHTLKAKKCFMAQGQTGVIPCVHSNEPAFLSATRVPFHGGLF